MHERMSTCSEYTCQRCGYHTERKGDLKKHLMKKVTCAPIYEDILPSVLLDNLHNLASKSHVCEYCNKGFATPQSKCVHKKRCTARLEIATDQKIQQLEKQIQELQTQMKTTGTSVTHINNGTVNNTVNNIHINAFGKEDTSYLTGHPRFNDFMIKCIRGKVEGICEFLVKKHFNPDHPENHNIKKLNKKDEFIECYDGARWKLRFCDDVLEDIFLMMQKDFADFVESEEGLLKRVWIDTFMDKVGGPLNWDLSTSTYDCYKELSDEKKAELRGRIYKLACEHIYRHSKECNIN